MTLSPFDHTSLTAAFPDSIYGPEPEEPLRVLERAFAQRDNALEAALIPFWDPNAVSGTNLDSIARLVGIRRDGRSDEEFRNALLLTPFLNNHRVSIPELLELVNLYGVARVESLWAPGEDLFFWDGKSYMNGLEPMSGRYRSASMYWKITTSAGADHAFIRELLDKGRGVGVGVYIHFYHKAQATDIAGPGGAGTLSAPVNVDEVALIYGSQEVTRFSVNTAAGQCSFDLYETLVSTADTAILYEASTEAGQITLKGITCNHRNQFTITLEGLDGA